MAEVDTSSYPKPQPATNPLDQITKFGQAADALGNVEAGKAVQGAILPDGSIDREALAQSLKGTVAGSMKAIPTLNAYETLRQAGHVADEAGLDNFQKRMAVVNHLFGQLASKDNPTIQDVNSIAARILDPALNGPKYGLTFPVIMNALKNFRGPDGRPLPAPEIKKRALDLQTMTATTAEQLAAHSPRQEVVDDGATIRFEPTGTQINPRNPAIVKRIPVGTAQIPPGQRAPVLTPPQEPAPSMSLDRQGRLVTATPGTTVSTDTYGRPITDRNNPLSGVVAPANEPGATPNNRVAQGFSDAYGSRLTGAPRAALEPGVARAAESTAENSATMFNNINTAAAEVPATRGILDNLERELKSFTPGPGADYRRIGKAFANTILPDSLKEAIGFDPKSIADQEGFNKLAYNLAQNQFQALGGTGTDAKLNSTMATSPSELLSKEGNAGIIRLLKGNTDALAVRASEANKWKKKYGEASAADFVDEFNAHFNPRVFQFKYIPAKEKNTWYQAMSPEERRQFERDLKYADEHKWIKQ